MKKQLQPKRPFKTRLPKQWLHWAYLMRIRPERPRHAYAGHYMIGRGRRWRVNSEGSFEMSCPLAEFDRWANSREASLTFLPRTEEEFREAISLLPACAALAEFAEIADRE